VTVSIVSPSRLAKSEIAELYAFFSTAFSADRAGFERDLMEKEQVLRIHGSLGQLEAFSSLAIFHPKPDVRVVFSGDTYASPAARSGHRLPTLWARYVFREMPRMAGVSDYWLLLCSGYRTYRILPTFFSSFVPGPEGSSELELLRERWGRLLFGERYAEGVVKPRWATPLLDPEPPERLCHDPHVRFFLEKNPGYREGDELACLLSLAEENLRPAGRRLALRS